MSGLRLTGLRKSFGATEVIRGVSLEVPKGGFGVFVGPSGCGKSTLLRMIAGLEETGAGTIEIDGRNVTHVAPAKRGIAMVFQSYALYPHLSVFDNMAFSLRLARRKKAAVSEKVLEAARILRLEDHLAKKPAELSGGQRQRVAIGRAIVREPDVFLFDEPLSNLDAELRSKMRLELARLHRQIGATMIYVTHDQMEAMTLADRIFVLKNGELQQSGRPLDLYDDPANRFVGGFIGSPAMNFLDAIVTERTPSGIRARVEPDGWEAEARLATQDVGIGQSVVLGVRPEKLRLGDKGLSLKVKMVEELGGVSYLHTRTAGGSDLVIERRGRRDGMDGETLLASAEAEDVLVFLRNGERLR